MALSPIIFLALIALAAVFIARAIRQRLRAPAFSDIATCGKCGYAVRGVSTFNCPECGSDLREVGIVPPHQSKRKQPSLPLRLIGWTVLVLILAPVTNAFLTSRLPRVRTTSTALTFRPASSGFLTLSITADYITLTTTSTAVMSRSTSRSSPNISPSSVSFTSFGQASITSKPERINVTVWPSTSANLATRGATTPLDRPRRENLAIRRQRGLARPERLGQTPPRRGGDQIVVVRRRHHAPGPKHRRRSQGNRRHSHRPRQRPVYVSNPGSSGNRQIHLRRIAAGRVALRPTHSGLGRHLCCWGGCDCLD